MRAFALLLAVAHVVGAGGPKLRGSGDVGSSQLDQMRAAVPPRQNSLPSTVETIVAARPEDDVERMIARRKALLGRAIGLRRDVVTDHVADLDSTYDVTQEMKDHFGPPLAARRPLAHQSPLALTHSRRIAVPHDKFYAADRDAAFVCWSSTRRMGIPAGAGVAWRA